MTADRYHAALAALAARAADAAPAELLPRLRKLLEQLLHDEHARQNQPFGNLSQAIAWVGHARQLPPALRRGLHALRLAANLVLHESYAGTAQEVAHGFAALAQLTEELTGAPYAGPRPPGAATPPTLAPAAGANAAPEAVAAPERHWRVHVLAADPAGAELLAEAETPGAGGTPAGAFRVRVPEAYRGLLPHLVRLRATLLLLGPITTDDAEETAGDAPAGRPSPFAAFGERAYCPPRLVLEPDYLVSVTTVADCVQWKETLPDWPLQHAFQPDEASRPLVLGNLVNQLLDEEVSHAARAHSAGEAADGAPDAAAEFDFERFVQKRLFQTNPLPLSALAEFQTPHGLRTLLADLRQHHHTLRETRRQGFAATSQTGYQQERLNLADCFLEPTFLSATYGLQGRLDLLHESPTGYDLIELKSSKTVPGGLPWVNHQAQAQLYRLLLGSTLGEGEPARGRTSILYSAAASTAAVRPVLRDEPLIDRLLAARNELVAKELLLAQARGPAETAALLAPVLEPDPQRLPSYGRERAQAAALAWNRADAVERAYALELVRFSARELRLALLGDDARPGDAGGQAGLWRLSETRKRQNFSLLDGLELVENHADAADEAPGSLGPHLVFQRPADGPEVNFRAGDSLLLYPRRKAQTGAAALGPLNSQVVKVTLADDLGADGRVVVSLRNRRIAPRYLSDHSHWALEPDTYDTFRREWAQLTAFLELPAPRRRRLLARLDAGPRAPETADSPPAKPINNQPKTTNDQPNDAEEIVRRALAAPDWFVLCGPPGTGKTRKVLRELAVRLCAQDQQVLLAAYTNRAVDEICEQLVAAGLPFIRLGSRLGTAPEYRPYLLDHMLADCPNRQAVRLRIGTCPVYVGTVSALLNKPELFQLKRFDVAVVDEASQVLEGPMLALLRHVEKFILIGDHRQLPAVVVQAPETSAVAPEAAELLRRELGLTNLRNSYFERLFRRAEAHWPHAHGTLQDQYRMHRELAELVNESFYGGQLRCPEAWQWGAWPHPPGPPLPWRGGSLTTPALGIGDVTATVTAGNTGTVGEHVLTAGPKAREKLNGFAKTMRRAPTAAEGVLWQTLRNQQLGVKFRRQHALGNFIVDFACVSEMLIVEVDGEIHGEAEQAEYDEGRSHELAECGYRILRFANEQVLNQLPAVLSTITNALKLSSGSPLSTGEGGRGGEAPPEARRLFVPTRRQPADLSLKESSQEADLAARFVEETARRYGRTHFSPQHTVGVIASYRNQAALIRRRLAERAAALAWPELAQVTVDTVERYQGSQREVIVVSFCCHHEHQLELLLSPDETGTVDRKLNVALTRARQQLILLGNEQVLNQSEHHRRVLAMCTVARVSDPQA